MVSAGTRSRLGAREAAAAHLSIAGALVVFLVSCTVGILCDSIALMLDAGTGLVVVIMAFFARGALKKLRLPPDARFNFGYGKYESFAAAMQSFGIIVTCILGMIFALQDIIHPEDIVRYDLPTAATLFCGILSLALGVHLRAVSRDGGSSVLRSSALQWFVDAGLSFGMCAGFAFGIVVIRLGARGMAPYIDPGMAIVLALLFMRPPLKMISVNVRELLDAVPDDDLHHRIRSIAGRHEARGCGVHRVRVRKAGRRTFLDVCFVVRGGLTVKETEAIAADFEQDLVRTVPDCDAVVYFRCGDA